MKERYHYYKNNALNDIKEIEDLGRNTQLSNDHVELQLDMEDIKEIQEIIVVKEAVEDDGETQDNICIQEHQDTHIVDILNTEDDNHREEDDFVVELVDEEKLRSDDEEISESDNVSGKLR